MQTFPVEYTDRIHGFQGRFSKIITKAELKALLSRSSSICEKDRKQRCAIVRLTHHRHECRCGCRDVTAYRRRTRYVQGEHHASAC